VSSSGVAAALNGSVPIASYATRILAERGLERFAAPSWQQTTAGLVRASDVQVFLERGHYRFCEPWIDPNRQAVEIWDIQDVRPADAAGIMRQVEQTFELIRQRTDKLLATLGLEPKQTPRT
jgi:hypothetical protein